MSYDSLLQFLSSPAFTIGLLTFFCALFARGSRRNYKRFQTAIKRAEELAEQNGLWQEQRDLAREQLHEVAMRERELHGAILSVYLKRHPTEMLVDIAVALQKAGSHNKQTRRWADKAARLWQEQKPKCVHEVEEGDYCPSCLGHQECGVTNELSPHPLRFESEKPNYHQERVRVLQEVQAANEQYHAQQAAAKELR